MTISVAWGVGGVYSVGWRILDGMVHTLEIWGNAMPGKIVACPGSEVESYHIQCLLWCFISMPPAGPDLSAGPLSFLCAQSWPPPDRHDKKTDNGQERNTHRGENALIQGI